MRRAVLALILLAAGAVIGVGIYAYATREPPAPDPAGYAVQCNASGDRCWQGGREVAPVKDGDLCRPRGGGGGIWSATILDAQVAPVGNVFTCGAHE